MLELGKFSKKLHIEAAKIINKSDIDKIYVYGKKLSKLSTKLDHKKEENTKF